MGKYRLTRAEKQDLEDNKNHLVSIGEELREAETVSGKIKLLMDKAAVPESLREDCFQEAWVAQLQGKSIKEAVERFVRAEKQYKKRFSR